MAFRVFLSYSHKDAAFLRKLKTHLSILERQGLIEVWYDGHISAGTPFASAIDAEIEGAHIILVLVSANFFQSDFCYSREMDRALARAEAGTARVIPVIVRECRWENTRLGALQALPHNRLPLKKWPDIDAACADVIDGVRRVVGELTAKQGIAGIPAAAARRKPPTMRSIGAGSSTETGDRSFRSADRVRFLRNAYTQLSRHFERSLAGLKTAHAPMAIEFRHVDARTFVCRAEPDRRRAAECAISIVPDREWITFSEFAASRGNDYSECLCAVDDERGVFLRCLGLRYGTDPLRKMTPDEAASLLWSRFVEPLQT